MLDVGLPQQVDHYPGTRSPVCSRSRWPPAFACVGQPLMLIFLVVGTRSW